MYGPLVATLRSDGVRNTPRHSSGDVAVIPARRPVVVSSLNAPAVLNGLASSAGASVKRPLSVAGTLGPVCGSPRLWNWLSVNSGPLWQLAQLPLPRKTPRPLTSLAVSAPASPIA